MTFIRGVFIFAFVMLILGGVLARVVIGPLLFPNDGPPAYLLSVASRSPTATPHPSRTARPTPQPTARPTRPPTARPAAPATATPVPTKTPVPATVHGVTTHHILPHRANHRHASTRPSPTTTPAPRRTPTPRPTATSLPSPTPSPTPAGTVTLTNYWVGTATASPGSTIEVGYVIDNETGRTARVELGASVKVSSRLSWASAAISDPSHDVVAVVPPGVTTHVRYFTLASGLRAGSYDVAWGLRDADTGARVALAAASDALRLRGGYIPAP
jgi:hypothetical protein